MAYGFHSERRYEAPGTDNLLKVARFAGLAMTSAYVTRPLTARGLGSVFVNLGANTRVFAGGFSGSVNALVRTRTSGNFGSVANEIERGIYSAVTHHKRKQLVMEQLRQRATNVNAWDENVGAIGSMLESFVRSGKAGDFELTDKWRSEFFAQSAKLGVNFDNDFQKNSYTELNKLLAKSRKIRAKKSDVVAFTKDPGNRSVLEKAVISTIDSIDRKNKIFKKVVDYKATGAKDITWGSLLAGKEETDIEARTAFHKWAMDRLEDSARYPYKKGDNVSVRLLARDAGKEVVDPVMRLLGYSKHEIDKFEESAVWKRIAKLDTGLAMVEGKIVSNFEAYNTATAALSKFRERVQVPLAPGFFNVPLTLGKFLISDPAEAKYLGLGSMHSALRRAGIFKKNDTISRIISVGEELLSVNPETSNISFVKNGRKNVVTKQFKLGDSSHRKKYAASQFMDFDPYSAEELVDIKGNPYARSWFKKLFSWVYQPDFDYGVGPSGELVAGHRGGKEFSKVFKHFFGGDGITAQMDLGEVPVEDLVTIMENPNTPRDVVERISVHLSSFHKQSPKDYDQPAKRALQTYKTGTDAPLTSGVRDFVGRVYDALSEEDPAEALKLALQESFTPVERVTTGGFTKGSGQALPVEDMLEFLSTFLDTDLYRAVTAALQNPEDLLKSSGGTSVKSKLKAGAVGQSGSSALLSLFQKGSLNQRLGDLSIKNLAKIITGKDLGYAMEVMDSEDDFMARLVQVYERLANDPISGITGVPGEVQEMSPITRQEIEQLLGDKFVAATHLGAELGRSSEDNEFFKQRVGGLFSELFNFTEGEAPSALKVYGIKTAVEMPDSGLNPERIMSLRLNYDKLVALGLYVDNSAIDDVIAKDPTLALQVFSKVSDAMASLGNGIDTKDGFDLIFGEAKTKKVQGLSQKLNLKKEFGQFVKTFAHTPEEYVQFDQFLPTHDITVENAKSSLIDWVLDPAKASRQLGETLIDKVWNRSSLWDVNTPQTGLSSTLQILMQLPNELGDMVGLGLNSADTKTALRSTATFYGKRALPLFMGIGAYRTLVGGMSTVGLPTPNDLLANIIGNTSVLAADVSDLLGLTELQKEFVAKVPGLDLYGAPKSGQEERDYQTMGYEPVRRNRFWLIGNKNTFHGQEVKAYRPSLYRRLKSHWYEQDYNEQFALGDGTGVSMGTGESGGIAEGGNLPSTYGSYGLNPDGSAPGGTQFTTTDGGGVKFTKGSGIDGAQSSSNVFGGVGSLVDSVQRQTLNMMGLYGAIFERIPLIGGNEQTQLFDQDTNTRVSTHQLLYFSELGELSGPFGEFFRRFVPFPVGDFDAYSPVQNAMGRFLPNRFWTGNAYRRTFYGELNLPGPGFEAASPYITKTEGGTSSGGIGDNYDIVTKVEILANVAPNSPEYRQALKMAQAENLSSLDRRRLNMAVKRAVELNKDYELYPSQYGAKSEKKQITVLAINRDGTLSTNVGSVRLAGVKINDDSLAREGAAAIYGRFGISVGSVLDAKGLEGSFNPNISGEIVNPIVVGNLNAKLIGSDYANKDFDDRHPLSKDVSVGKGLLGFVAEKSTHSDFYIFNKLLRARTALEQFERGEVYGTDDASWNNFYDNYVKGTFNKLMGKDPITAGLFGGLTVSTFLKNTDDKLYYGAYGAAAMAGLALGRSIFDTFSGRQYVSDNYKRRAEFDEYWDILTYLKSTAVSTQAQTMTTKAGNELGPYAQIATAAERRAQNTMYAFDVVSGTLNQAIYALPRHQRQIAYDIATMGSLKEKQKFYDLLPDAQKRVIGKFLGVNQEDLPLRPDLSEYFNSKFLPGEDWSGWDVGVDIDDLKTRAADHEEIRVKKPSRTKVLHARQRTQGVEIPSMETPTIALLKQRIDKILYSSNVFSRLDVNYIVGPADSQNMLDLRFGIDVNRTRDITAELDQEVRRL